MEITDLKNKKTYEYLNINEKKCIIHTKKRILVKNKAKR